MKRVEGERDTLNTELIQARVQMSKVQSQSEDFTKEQAALQEQVEDLQAEKERVLRSKQEVGATLGPSTGGLQPVCDVSAVLCWRKSQRERERERESVSVCVCVCVCV